MTASQKVLNSLGLLMILKLRYRKFRYFEGRVRQMHRHTDGILQSIEIP